MDKIKWKRDKTNTWIANNTDNTPNDGFLIFKVWGGRYKLQPDDLNPFGLRRVTGGGAPGLYFKKLSSAKTVANLLRNG